MGEGQETRRHRARLAAEYGGSFFWLPEDPYVLEADELPISDQLRGELGGWIDVLSAQQNDGYPPDWTFGSERLHKAFNEMGLALRDKLAAEMPDWDIEYRPFG